jgi:hypothetical protein
MIARHICVNLGRKFGAHGDPRGAKKVIVRRALPRQAAGGARYILNIGGVSDAVFSVVAAFLRDDADRFVAEFEAIELWVLKRPRRISLCRGRFAELG